MGASREQRGLVLAGLAVIGFSLSLPMVKVALGGFDPWVVALGRAALAGVLAVAALRLARAPRPPRELWRPLVVTALCSIVIFPVLSTVALRTTTSSHAAVIIALLPIATAVFAVLRAGEHAPSTFWVGALAGTGAVVAFALSRGATVGGGGLVADLLLFGAVAGAAFGYVEGAVLSRSMPGWQVVSWTLVVCLPLTVPVSLGVWLATRDHYQVTWQSTGAMAYQAVITTFLAYFLWYAGLAAAGVARGSQLQNLQPVLTVGWSALLLGEVVDGVTWLAAVAVIAAVVWTQRARARPVVHR